MPIVLAVSIPFLFVALARPVVRRLAFRNAVRRPREAMLVVLGSLLGTAIMTGSFVVGDSFDASIRQGAFRQLGPADEVVSAVGLDAQRTLEESLAGFDRSRTDGVLFATRLGASVATVGRPRRAEPQSQLLEVDFGAAHGFGNDAHATGITGPTPVSGHAVISSDLASRLRVGAGARIEVFASGSSVKLRVDRVLPTRGIAGLWLGRESSSPNVFVAPGAIAALVGSSHEVGIRGVPPVGLALVSNRGGVLAGARGSKVVAAALRSQLHGVEANVATAKADLLDLAERQGKQLTQFYSQLGVFAILAGVLLLVNIFLMLADERRSELGMLRAVGLRRSSLVAAFSLEGWCYALVSCAAGTFIGLALGRGIIAFAAKIFSGSDRRFRLSVVFAFRWLSIQQGAAFGFVTAVATVIVASIIAGRVNIIQAIRDLSEPPPPRPRQRHVLAGGAVMVAGGITTAAGFAGPSSIALMVGPIIAALGIGPTLVRHFSRRAALTALSTLVIAWAIAAVPVAIRLDANVDVPMFILQGVTLTVAGVTLVSQHQLAIGRAVARFAGGSLAVRLGLAYPLARRMRTAMTLAMFSVVMFILSYTSVFAAMFRTQLDAFTADISGGFNVLVSSNPGNPIHFDQLARDKGVDAVAPLITSTADIFVPGDKNPVTWNLSGFDAQLPRVGAPRLDDRGGYPTDRAAYEAVLKDPTLAIVDRSFLSQGAGPPHGRVGIGDHFTARDPVSGVTRTFRVVATGRDDWVFNGGLVSSDAAAALWGDRAVASRAYVRAANPSAYADSIAGRYLARGGEGRTIRSLVSSILSQQEQFFVLMRGYLSLGLVVGIAGIGVIMVRAVRERRRQVGVLRALGFTPATVRRAFVVESSFVAIEGVLIGVVMAVIAAASVSLTDAFGSDLNFVVPFAVLAAFIAGTLLFTLLATLGPARAAARIEPAVALRIAD